MNLVTADCLCIVFQVLSDIDLLNASDSCMMGKVGLANVLKNLKMDNSSVNTTKAKEYLAAHKEFRSDSGINEPEHLVMDSLNNKVFCLQWDSVKKYYTTPPHCLLPELLTDRSNNFKKLAEEIEKNVDLICQLEYLIRGIPVRDTKHSIHLILQYLRFSSENDLITEAEVYFIQKDTPLLAVGCYLQSLSCHDFSYIYATNETAVICQFFTELCQNAELCIKLIIGDSQSLSSGYVKYPSLFNGFTPEVTGVITEKSDVDSAIDIFLNSERHPFPLTRIFVQESIYEDVKDIISWKCKSPQNTNIRFKCNSKDAFKYENKIFYLDFAGNIEETKNLKDHLVFVEAFRTVNDVISLLHKTPKQLCMSLWASGVSEANEIALNVNVPIVWINDYCNFYGPPAVSQAFFDKTYYSCTILTDNSINEQLMQHQKAWAKKTHIERYEKVIKAFESANQGIGNALKEKNKSYWKFNDFIALQDKTMIMGFYLPIPVVSFNWSHGLRHDINHPKMMSIWLSIAKALINGSAIGYQIEMSRYDDLILEILEMLPKFGLPLAHIEIIESSDFQHKMTCSYNAESVQTKVIWTSFGTTFAN